jgi:hypothetical protein
MHKLIEYICDELEELERKADKDGKLSMAEIQYGDVLAHFKKNLLKGEEMMEDDEGYSMNMGGGYSRRGDGDRTYRVEGSYARGRRGNVKRDTMGRYSRRGGYSMADESMISELRELMQDAPDEHIRQEFQKFIDKVERM